MTLTHGGQTYTIDRSAESIAPDSIVTVMFDAEINVRLNTTEDYTLTISSMEGSDVETIQGSITCFERTVLIEEGTGTWCMWCPRGQYYLKELHKKRPGEFVDIAVHVSDEMMVYDYAMTLYAPFFATYGLPSCVMDRQLELMNGLGSLEEIEAMLDKARERGAIGRFTELFSMTNTQANGLYVHMSCEFGRPIEEGEYSVNFIMVEDKVTGYAQANGYSGSSSAMGGLDLLPDPIPAGEYTFANVGRIMLAGTDRSGRSLTLPAHANRHTSIVFDYEFDYPEIFKVSGDLNYKVVGMIIDNQTGEIVNAAEGGYDVAEGIDGLPASTSVRLQGGTLTADSPLLQVEIWSLSGQLLHKENPNSDRYTLPQTGTKGQPVIIRATTDGENATFKSLY